MKLFNSLNLSRGTVIILIIAAVVVAFQYFGNLAKEEEEYSETIKQQESLVVTKQLTIRGEVSSINLDENSLSIIVAFGEEEVDFLVQLGEATNIVQIKFPFDLDNPPKETLTFKPERAEVMLEDIKEGDIVFIRSSHAITPGEDIKNPLEVQILP